MNDAGTALRKAIYQVLNGNLTYGGNPVPVFDHKVEGDPWIWVLLAGQADTNRSNKSRFAVEKNQEIDIYHLRNSTAQSEVLESLSDQILTILLPDVRAVGFTLNAPFHLTFCRMDSTSLYGVQPTPDKRFLHGKKITLKNRITQ